MTNEAGLAVHILSTEDDGYVDMHEWMHELADTRADTDVAYFIGGDEGAIKIGFSGSVQVRLKTLRIKHKRKDLRILATRPGGKLRECAYHNQFYHHALGYEWFERHPDVLSEIDRLNNLTNPHCERCEGEGRILVEDRPRPDDISPSAHYEPCPECQG